MAGRCRCCFPRRHCGLAWIHRPPAVQGESAGLSVFAAICRSLGLQPGSPAARQPSSKTKAQPVSMVAWTPQVIERLHHPNTKNGNEIAANICASCHGEKGESATQQTHVRPIGLCNLQAIA
ncbi:MAG: hypothetical protein J2P49_02975 [Methylocapsa sp.]|nr:hypothetical protein [Methylocapsa sp.]